MGTRSSHAGLSSKSSHEAPRPGVPYPKGAYYRARNYVSLLNVQYSCAGCGALKLDELSVLIVRFVRVYLPERFQRERTAYVEDIAPREGMTNNLNGVSSSRRAIVIVRKCAVQTLLYRTYILQQYSAQFPQGYHKNL